MVWLTLGVLTLGGFFLVWIATQENRSARVLGAAAVIVHTLTLAAGLTLDPTSVWTSVVGVVAVMAQAALLGVVTLWIATRQSRMGRVIGAVVLSTVAVALIYGMMFGPVWKINALIVGAIALTWIWARQKRQLVRA